MAGAKESPRQKMIGMMYLVLTCLLALNVSKDILKGFVTVNESLEKTNQSMQLSNEQMLSAFEEAAKQNKSAKAYYEKAIESQKKTAAVIAYIEQMKKKLIEVTEKVDKNIADTMRLRFVEKMDDYDIPTYQLIGSDETKPSEGAFSAKELRGKLSHLHSELLALIEGMNKNKSTLLPKKDYEALKTKIGIIKPVDTNEMEDDIKVTWEIQNFYHLPLAAVITNLSKIQSDIKNVETEMINQLAAASGKLVVKFDKFAAKVVAPSKYIRSGENFTADIILSASSSDFKDDNMQILMGAKYDPVTKSLIEPGTPLPLVGGMGKVDLKTSGQGQQNLSGVIKFKNGKGEIEYFPFEENYMVAAPAAAVSADNMNVLYAGLSNPITISAAGVAPTNLVAKVNGNTAPLIPAGNGKYTITPVTTGTCEVAVYSREVDGSLKPQGAPSKFRIKSLPVPFVKINGKYVFGTFDMKKLEATSLGAIAADIPGFDLNAKFKVKSFVVSVLNNGTINEFKCAGNNLSEDAKKAIGKLKSGSKIFIEDIIAMDPTQKEVPLSNVTIRLKG